MKIAIIVLSDPKSGAEEALGRLFNALAAAYDYDQTGAQVSILFQGTGTRWPAELVKPEHPGHSLFNQVNSLIGGVSCGCADVFGATEGAEQAGMTLVKDNPVPETGGLPSLTRLQKNGYTLLNF